MPRPRKTLASGLGDPLYAIEVPGASQDHATDLLQDCRYIGSYDWAPSAKKGNPVIVVPGSPNVWQDLTLPFTLQPDVGIHFRDRNNAILQGQPFLPLLAAVNEEQLFPREEWKTVDFVTDRNGLRKLLRWVVKASGRDFRIDTQLVGDKTVVLNRREPSVTEKMPGHTFGFHFEEATTRPMPPSNRRSGHHHRIVTYKFGRFRIVVQFEVDACLSREQASTSNSEEDELINAMAGMGLQSQAQGMTSGATASASTRSGADSRPKSNLFGMTIYHRGHADIPHSSIVEMASTSSTIKWDDRFPQLYFSQTGNHHLGHHQGGVFDRIDKLTLSSPKLQAVHQKLRPAFAKLEEALGQIQSILVEHGKEERLSLIYEKKELKVYRCPNQSSSFPPEALALFD
ncbi:hypothetical protein NP233_g2065 [Leucocoprinus birnbaumii]|uniref:Geranylgeranyl pyrophosphate synthetase n=1 Tax=Leucocoprinus birnbaumii TaxID=56174 RepID=A0AAD5VZI4_9AGAR|nr:hypothetical protein NP233_g2065 [Leucocoprinus birnbaumii]